MRIGIWTSPLAGSWTVQCGWRIWTGFCGPGDPANRKERYFLQYMILWVIWFLKLRHAMSSWFLSHKAVGISTVWQQDRVFGGQYGKIALLFLALPLRGSPWMRLAIKWSSKNCIIDRGATIENEIPYTDSLLASYEAPLSYQGCPILLDRQKSKQKVDTCNVLPISARHQ